MSNNPKLRIRKGSIQYLIILIIAISLCGMIIYPIIDFFICMFIQHTKFIYTFKFYVIQPIIGGMISGLSIWLLDRKR